MGNDMGSTSIKVGTGRRTRTNTGCITCRIRRVKCDETKPNCNKCAYSRRVCDGYLLASAPPQTRSHTSGQEFKTSNKPLSRRALAVAVRQLNAPGPSVRLLLPSPYLGDDVACFDFFRFRLTTGLEGSKGPQAVSGFWNSTLLQASHVEPAVWHAVAALGALHRKWEVVSSGSLGKQGKTSSGSGFAKYLDEFDSSTSSLTDDGNEGESGRNLTLHSVRLAEQAGTCYTKALSLARSIRDPSIMLVLSIALAATANVSGRWVDSSVHYRAGQRIMSQLRKDCPNKSMTELQINAAESLAKLGLQLVSFQEQSAPYPCIEIHEIGVSTTGEPFPRSLVSSQDQRTWGLHRANIELVDIVRRILLEAGLHNPGDLSHSVDIMSRTQSQRGIIKDLEKWEYETIYILSNTIDPTHRKRLDLLCIKLLHTLARLFIAASVMNPDIHSELSWDDHLAHFDRILTLGALILRIENQQNPLLLSVMSLDEPAINMALWITATRCRQPMVRRRALQLLRGARRLEGSWMSNSAAAAAERMIQIEEEGLDNLTVQLPQWETLEPTLMADIEAEDREPRSWLGPEAKWGVKAASKWNVSGAVIVPLERRITQVDVSAEYDAHVGRSRGDLVLIFAGRDDCVPLRRGKVSVYF
ncbi:hypothetical protein N0V93_000028 [Gnomoniopsis smithogilvyi]|uniref:Zn(2)-C6 fungal-type domain-containing protein n=1 Tax=Gnomoniopsis smithogilvyi TaxID=1191159 RepID=A0A9W8YZH7_9PEZI|nr:hypothetical protein N0V93_000028 [Gnomoniopsis smithogilvyi]